MTQKGFTLKGVTLVVANIKKFGGNAAIGSIKGLRTWGEATLTVIKEREVPIKFGILKGSGKVDEAGMKDKPEIEISFGGDHPASGYAIAVHEIPASHKHGGDKYLERGALAEASKLKGDVGKAVKSQTGMR